MQSLKHQQALLDTSRTQQQQQKKKRARVVWILGQLPAVQRARKKTNVATSMKDEAELQQLPLCLGEVDRDFTESV